MMSRKKSTTGADPNSVSFEEALAGLEGIVEAMEQSQLPLEELVDHYEKGSALLTHCESILKSARGRIELITLRNQQGGPSALPAGTNPSTVAPQASADETNDDDDIRLF
jgi:exodeoxyribonuclease VII small subunit